MQKDSERGDTLRVEVAMRKFLSLAVMCSLALPAMAFAQDEEVLEEEVMEESVEAPAAEPTPMAIQEQPEPPKLPPTTCRVRPKSLVRSSTA